MTSSRSAGVAGLLYVLLLVTGIAVLGTPEGDAPDAEWVDHFTDSGNRTRVLLAGMSVMGAGLAFLVAAPGLVRRAGPVASAASVAHAVLVLLAGLAGASIAIVVDVAGMPLPDDPDLLRLSDALLFATLLIPGLLTAGLLAWCVARSDDESLPTGVRRAGYVVAILSLGGIALIPALLWLVWVAVLSALALRRAAPAAA
jgi:hypothetical protein